MVRLFFSGLLLLLLVGCHSAGEVAIIRVRDLGPLPRDSGIRCRDGGYSALWRGRSWWFFGDTVTDRPAASGFCWLSNSMMMVSDWSRIDRGEWLMREHSAAIAVPVEFFPWLPEEAAYNRQHFNSGVSEKDRSRYAVWPGAAVTAPDDSCMLLFFGLLRCGGNGAWDFHGIGRSLAVWEREDEPPRRLPMLFPEGDIELGDAGLALDGRLYLYGCDNHSLRKPIRLGRVPFAAAGDRSQWEFYAGDGRWSKLAQDAVPLFDGAPMLSVHWNGYLGKYLAFYTVPLANRVVCRTADCPEGPWSDPVFIADCLASTGACGCYAGLGHGELARQNGAVEYVTYYRDTGLFQGEIRLLEVTFAPPPGRGAGQGRP